jgi:hypothetical protein
MRLSQFNYFLGPDDQLALDRLIQNDGRFCFLHQPIWPGDQLLTRTAMPIPERKWPLFMCIVRPEDEAQMAIHFIEAQGYSLPDTSNGYVIEYGRCYFDGKLIRRARMAFSTIWVDAQYHPHFKDEGFIREARSIFRKVKKSLTLMDNGWYAGSQALTMKQQGIRFDY